MTNQQAYNTWANIYDTNANKTRDLEAVALRKMLDKIPFSDVLEIGCGTGKNTEWLITKAKSLVGADFSVEMLEKAKQKITAPNVSFQQMDIRENWVCQDEQFDLITCSLVLEHIENIDFIFQQASRVLKGEGYFYIGEFHPFKQYQGRKARFETNNGTFELETFTHNVSAFIHAAEKHDFTCIRLEEWFDNDDQTEIPRILAMIFQKKSDFPY